MIQNKSREMMPGARSGALRIQLVEDDHDSAEMLSLLLEMEGHQVRVAHDGPGGLAEILADPPELVLLDIGLPGMDGYEVAREVRRRLSPDRMPKLVTLSGYDQPPASECGIWKHLVKPIPFDKLDQLLRELLGLLDD